jgi:HAD superfamily hydrolase (TIGR01490 family)
MNIAFFDFDGTITNTDSLFRFIRYSKGNFRFYIGMLMLAPVFLFFKLKLIKNWRAKEIVLSWFFKGTREVDFVNRGKRFARHVIPRIIREEASQALAFHQANGDKIVIVTASLSVWIKPWCDTHQFGLIATSPEFENGRFTGRIAGKNCYGEEKVRRIKTEFDLGMFMKIYAYGDSIADMEMINLADIKYLRWSKMD